MIPFRLSQTTIGGACARNNECSRGEECECDPRPDDDGTDDGGATDEAADFFGDEEGLYDNEERLLLQKKAYDFEYELEMALITEEKAVLMRRLATKGGKKGRCRFGGTCVFKSGKK